MEYITRLCINAKKAKDEIGTAETEDKKRVLELMGDYLIDATGQILEQNEIDVYNAKKRGIKDALIDRLCLTDKRVESMAKGLHEVAQYKDPIGKILDTSVITQGMILKKVSAPMGVIGIIYESRPNVTADAAALCIMAGSAVILRGGSDAINSNKAIVKVLRRALIDCDMDENIVQLVEDTSRKVATDLMKAKKYIDLLIPRGGADLIASVMENSTIPVIETGTGNCHIYIDEYRDVSSDKASVFSRIVDIVENAKCQRPGVCNAVETLLVHESVHEHVLPLIMQRLSKHDVQIRACERSIKVIPNAIPATKADWETEYLDCILAVKVVDSVEQAIEHINKYGSGHSEAILTDIRQNADKFTSYIDAACIYVNASTRFTDGGEFGLGAEIGISTQKLHARGPMGANEITTYKYIIEGNGNIR